MRHELTAKVGSNHVNMKLFEMEVYTHGIHQLFQPPISTEIPFAWCQQPFPCDILKTKYHYSNNCRHTKNAKQHLAKHLKVSTKCQQIAIILRNIVILMLLFPYQSFRLLFLLLFPFLAFLLRHSLLAPRPTVRSCPV